jgi:hypothetical protein
MVRKAKNRPMQVVVARGGFWARRYAIHPRIWGSRRSVAMKMKTAGRKTASIYHRYNIVNESDLRKAMEKQGTYLNEVAAKETKPAVTTMVQ